MARLYTSDDVEDVAYVFHTNRDTALKVTHKLPLPEEWYTSVHQKAQGGNTQDEQFLLTLERYELSDGTTSEWIASPFKTDINANGVYYDQVKLTGKQVLKFLHELYENGDTIHDGFVDVF